MDESVDLIANKKHMGYGYGGRLAGKVGPVNVGEEFSTNEKRALDLVKKGYAHLNLAEPPEASEDFADQANAQTDEPMPARIETYCLPLTL